MGKIKIGGWICERCGHRWVARKEAVPVVCSRCKSPYWNTKRKVKVKCK